MPSKTSKKKPIAVLPTIPKEVIDQFVSGPLISADRSWPLVSIPDPFLSSGRFPWLPTYNRDPKQPVGLLESRRSGG